MQLVPCDETLIVRGQQDVQWTTLRDQDCPVAVVFRHYHTPPHQPWHRDHKGRACLVVFLARLEGQPRPATEIELPALIWLDPVHILRTAQRDVRLEELLRTKAELIPTVSSRYNWPHDSRVRLTDSQEALVLALREDSLGFYQRLARSAQHQSG